MTRVPLDSRRRRAHASLPLEFGGGARTRRCPSFVAARLRVAAHGSRRRRAHALPPSELSSDGTRTCHCPPSRRRACASLRTQQAASRSRAAALELLRLHALPVGLGSGSWLMWVFWTCSRPTLASFLLHASSPA
eukprot:TRINITY_DN1505_c0_g1_i10.p2 TRINITY_DN1505_c0_g1~~TRINITY_DN1505_c0_g1_i10.p2  ORF type:complete len:135 (+),score=36.76 TRINITY_DN1505_c0_g1_i10:483-887(+)